MFKGLYVVDKEAFIKYVTNNTDGVVDTINQALYYNVLQGRKQGLMMIAWTASAFVLVSVGLYGAKVIVEQYNKNKKKKLK